MAIGTGPPSACFKLKSTRFHDHPLDFPVIINTGTCLTQLSISYSLPLIFTVVDSTKILFCQPFPQYCSPD